MSILSKSSFIFVFLLQAYCFMKPLSVQLKPRQPRLISAINTISCQDESVPYLDGLNKKNNEERLKSLRKNITKYIVANKKSNNTIQAVKTKQSRPSIQPIMPIDFDNLFLNINNISKIYMSSDYDRVVFYFTDNRRHIYLVKSKRDKDLMEKIIKFISQPVRIVVICDKTVFTDKFGFLYYDV